MPQIIEKITPPEEPIVINQPEVVKPLKDIEKLKSLLDDDFCPLKDSPQHMN